MDLFTIVLRIVHIFAAVLWVGGGIVLVAFIEPTVKATAPAGQKFMQYFMVRRHYSTFMGIVSMLTVFAGALLYWKDSGGLQLAWITTPTGLGFTLGAVLGITMAIVGFTMIRPHADRLGALGAQIEAAGKPPTPAQLAELGALDKEMSRLNRLDFVLLSLALLAMATARYW